MLYVNKSVFRTSVSGFCEKKIYTFDEADSCP